MSIIGQKDVSDLYDSAEQLKDLVNNVKVSLQSVVTAITVIQALPAYNGTSSAGDKSFLTGLGTSAQNIVNTINALNWPF